MSAEDEDVVVCREELLRTLWRRNRRASKIGLEAHLLVAHESVVKLGSLPCVDVLEACKASAVSVPGVAHREEKLTLLEWSRPGLEEVFDLGWFVVLVDDQFDLVAGRTDIEVVGVAEVPGAGPVEPDVAVDPVAVDVVSRSAISLLKKTLKVVLVVLLDKAVLGLATGSAHCLACVREVIKGFRTLCGNVVDEAGGPYACPGTSEVPTGELSPETALVEVNSAGFRGGSDTVAHYVEVRSEDDIPLVIALKTTTAAMSALVFATCASDIPELLGRYLATEAEAEVSEGRVE